MSDVVIETPPAAIRAERPILFAGQGARWSQLLSAITIAAGTLVPVPALGQCRFPSPRGVTTLTYAVNTTVTPQGRVLHVTLAYQGDASGTERIKVPEQWNGQKLHGIINLRPTSDGATITDSTADSRTVRHPPSGRVVLAYDIIRDWNGPLQNPVQFHGVVMPDYFELSGVNALISPLSDRSARVAVNFDWTGLPAPWALATSFGASSTAEGRCQSYRGSWGDVVNSVFSAGDFRLHRFTIAKQPAVLAIRGEWSFTDDAAVTEIKSVVTLLRDFWHDYDFPFFLVTVKPFDVERGSGNGSAFTNAFWIYLSKLDSFTVAVPTLAHESFHAWNPLRMGTSPDSEQNAITWFYEGFTRHYTDVLLYRAGKMTLATVVASVNRDLRDYPVSSSPYVRGRVIALWLDAEIRTRSGGTQSLDNMMIDMVREAKQPLTLARILATAGGYIPDSAREELRRATARGAPLPAPTGALGQCAHVSIDSLPAFRPGFDVQASRAKASIVGIDSTGPAYRAGLRDGQRVTRISIYNGLADSLIKVTIQEGAESRAIAFYPQGDNLAVYQYHLDPGATADRSADRCAVPRVLRIP